jgi:hypothetical protein
MINLTAMSFKLLYLMDEVSDPAMSVLAEGFLKNQFNLASDPAMSVLASAPVM